MPPGADPLQLGRLLHRAHDTFVQTGGSDLRAAEMPEVRQVVVDSWRRSLGSWPRSRVLDGRRSRWTRRTSPTPAPHTRWPSAMPVIRRLLVDRRGRGGPAGRGQRRGRPAAVGGGLIRCCGPAPRGCTSSPAPTGASAVPAPTPPAPPWPSASPSRSSAPNTCVRQVTPWSCSAAPIREPDTGAILGVLDLTGGPEVAATADPGPGPGHRRRGRGRAAARPAAPARAQPVAGHDPRGGPAGGTGSSGRAAQLRSAPPRN